MTPGYCLAAPQGFPWFQKYYENIIAHYHAKNCIYFQVTNAFCDRAVQPGRSQAACLTLDVQHEFAFDSAYLVYFELQGKGSISPNLHIGWGA